MPLLLISDVQTLHITFSDTWMLFSTFSDLIKVAYSCINLLIFVIKKLVLDTDGSYKVRNTSAGKPKLLTETSNNGSSGNPDDFANSEFGKFLMFLLTNIFVPFVADLKQKHQYEVTKEDIRDIGFFTLVGFAITISVFVNEFKERREWKENEDFLNRAIPHLKVIFRIYHHHMNEIDAGYKNPNDIKFNGNKLFYKHIYKHIDKHIDKLNPFKDGFDV